MPTAGASPLTDFVDNPGSPWSLSVRLFKNQLAVGVPLTLASFQEANFPGYERKQGDIWSARTSTAAGGPSLRSYVLSWDCLEATRPNDVWGWYVVAEAGQAVELVGFELFDLPCPMRQAGDSMGYLVALDEYQGDYQ
jgi:hypothetical protein